MCDLGELGSRNRGLGIPLDPLSWMPHAVHLCLARERASQAGRAARSWAVLSSGVSDALNGGLRACPPYLWGPLTRTQLAA